MANEFSAVWFDTFLSPRNAAPVQRELAFIQAHLPRAEYRRLLDVPCGIGRHSGPLSELGYEVTGIDRSDVALRFARQRYPDVEFHKLDMLELGSLRQEFDGLLCLWQSFGYGDTEQNRKVLDDMREALRPAGRLVLDIYNAEALALLPAASTDDRGGRTVRTRRARTGRRLRVELEYSDSNQKDVHDWEVYSPSEIQHAAGGVGLRTIVGCAWFDPSIPPSSDHLRMQFVFERDS